eukprot:240571_1
MDLQFITYVIGWYGFSILFPFTLKMLKNEMEFSLTGTIFLSLLILISPSIYYCITNKSNQNTDPMTDASISQKDKVFNTRVFIIGVCHSTNLFMLVVSAMLIGASSAYIWKTLEVIGISFISSIIMKLEKCNLSTLVAVIFNFIGIWLCIFYNKQSSNQNDGLKYIGHTCGILAVIATAMRNVNVAKYKQVYQRKLYVWEFSIVSMLFFVLPIFIVSLVVHFLFTGIHLKNDQFVLLIKNHYFKLLVLSLSHFIYNICSIAVLNICQPTYHALLKSGKRIVVILSVSTLTVYNTIGLAFITSAIIIAKTNVIKTIKGFFEKAPMAEDNTQIDEEVEQLIKDEV